MDNTKYTCPRCHYRTDKKSNYVKHLHSKSPCSALYNNASREGILSALIEEKEFKCNSCNKSFSHATSLRRHTKTHPEEDARPNITINNIVNTDSHDTTINNTNNDSHDTITNNINITVNLLPFGREDISHIENDDELLKQCIQDIAKGIPNIVQAIYFNDDKPENQNVKLGKEHYPPEMKVYRADANGNPSWQAAERSGVLHELVDKGARILITFENKVFSLQQEQDRTEEQEDEDRERHDFRNNKFSSILTKTRGVYAPVRNAVLVKAKEHYKNECE